MLLAGAATVEISPEVPIALTGYGPGRVARAIHDDLHVAALYLEDPVSGERLGLLTYDMAHTEAGFIAEVQQACAAETGLPETAVLTTVSHAHSSPTIRPDRTDSPQEREKCLAWRKRVVARSAEALARARNDAVRVEVYMNTTRVRENINRRVFFPDGTYYYQPLHKHLSPVADGPVDDELGMLFFFKGEKKSDPVATLVNYTAHPLTVGDTSSEVSADYPGVLKREIERSLGGVALFITGAAGDNHPLGAEAGFGRCERMGQTLAEKVLYHRWDAVKLEESPLGVAWRDLVLPAMTDDDFARVPGHYGSGERLAVPEYAKVDDGIGVKMSLWSVGPVLFVGTPGELVAELGLRIKWDSPFAKTFIMYLATEHLGYMAHRNAFEWGGYEAIYTRYGPDAGTRFCDAAVAAAHELKARIEATGRAVTLPRRNGE